MELERLPGGDWIRAGLDDLERGVESVASLLVSIGAARLERAGVVLPRAPLAAAERRLYERLASENVDSAHSRYNAMIRRLVSFERAAECAGR